MTASNMTNRFEPPLKRCPTEQDLGDDRAVLVVEDDPQVMSLLRQALGRRGYRMIEAVDAVGALTALTEQCARISLVLSDLDLPDMTGDVLARLVSYKYPKLPIALMSGMVASPDVMGAPGVRAWLPKPFGLPALYRTVDRLVA